MSNNFRFLHSLVTLSLLSFYVSFDTLFLFHSIHHHLTPLPFLIFFFVFSSSLPSFPSSSLPSLPLSAGDLERLRKFWFQGACKPSKSKGKLSKPLDVNQFMSAFLLLGCGILLTILLLALEHCYFRSCRKRLAKADTDGCFTLVSLVSPFTLPVNCLSITNVHFLIPFFLSCFPYPFPSFLTLSLRVFERHSMSSRFNNFSSISLSQELTNYSNFFSTKPFFSRLLFLHLLFLFLSSFSLILSSVSLSLSLLSFSLFLSWSFSLFFLSPCLLQSMATSLNLPDTSEEGSEGVRRRKSLIAMQNRSSLCTDPNCDTKLLRMRQELQLTKLKLKQVEHLSRKQQLQLQGRLNLSNDCSFAQEEGTISQNSTRGRTSFQFQETSSSKGALEGRRKGKKQVIARDDSMVSSKAAMRKDKVSNVPSRPKSSLAFVQIETVI